jgi:hypothetical protein
LLPKTKKNETKYQQKEMKERKKVQRAEGISGAARKNEGGVCVYARHNDACSQRSYAQISFALSARKRRAAQLLYAFLGKKKAQLQLD